MNTPVLEVTNLSKNFGGLRALNEVDLTINRQEIVALIGPNGAGKTTFFNCITGTNQGGDSTQTGGSGNTESSGSDGSDGLE